MKRNLSHLIASFLLAASLSALAQLETAFTYQGRLVGTNGPLNGEYDVGFSLYDNDNFQIGSTITNDAVVVTEGHFSVLLDFGPDSFRRRFVSPRQSEGPGEWLEIKVRTNSNKAVFQMLSPRQRITPTPFASTVTRPLPSSALEGNYSEKVTFNNSSNAFLGSYYGDGFNLTNLNLSGLWQLKGNADTIPGSDFLGTTDNQALELRVNGGRALRLEPHATSPNLVGGYLGNLVSGGAYGAVISGGGSGTDTNRVSAIYGTVGGGSGNASGSMWSTVGGGRGNTVQANSANALVAGGSVNTVGSDSSGGVIGGGTGNTVSAVAPQATISGGSFNQALGTFAALGGGERNQATNYATVSGGNRNRATGRYATVGGGNTNSASGLNSVVSGGINNLAADVGATVGGGEENAVLGSRSTVGGGWGNIADTSYSTVSGGQSNATLAFYSTVAGGGFNTASGRFGIVAGGYLGQAAGDYSAVLGGSHNVAQGSYSFAGGYYATAAHASSFIWNGEGTASQSTTEAGQFKVHAPGGALFHTGTNALYASGEMSCGTLTIRGGADLAEPFALSEETIEPGAVVVIDPDRPGRLKLSTTAYDHKVAGIVSGAGGVQPGISMIQAEKLEGGRNVALSGRVYALVDATQHAVRPGDLLTTSDTPGHAMKAVNSALAPGAVLGKAMTPLAGERGLVLVLVSLQ